MRDFNGYIEDIKTEMKQFNHAIPSSRGTITGMKTKIETAIKVLPEVEKFIITYSKQYFDIASFSAEEMAEIKRINTEIYRNFIDVSQIPMLSRKLN